MYIVTAEENQIKTIVDISVRAFETDVNVGGAKGDCPPGYDSVEWHKQMAQEGHLYQAMIGKDLVGAAIIFQDETKNSVYIGRIFIDSIYQVLFVFYINLKSITHFTSIPFYIIFHIKILSSVLFSINP